MGTTSDKLTYLNGTKQALKDSINNIGGSITDETTFRAYAEELDNIYSSLPKTTGEGSNLSLSPTLKGKLNIEAYKGDTSQDTYEGYNLLPTTISQSTHNGITIQKQTDGSYKVTGTATENAILYILNESDNITLPSGSYYISGCPSDGTSETYRLVISVGGTLYGEYGSGRAITTNASGKLSAYIYVGAGTTVNLTYYPMLTSGSTQKPYQKYVGGQASPNPTYPQDINVVTGTQEVVVQNKNKLPSGESGTYTSSGATHTSNGKGVYTINGTATGTSFHNFQIAPYTIKSGDYLHLGNSVANGNVAIALLVSGSEQIMFRSCNAINVIQDLSSYAGKVVNYVRTFTNAQTLSNFEIKPMICNSSTQTDYVEHQEQTKTLHLSSSNLCNLNLNTTTIAGVTLTKNNDNTITANGTATSTIAVNILNNNGGTSTDNLTLPKGTYTLSGCPSGGGTNTNYKLDLVRNNGPLITDTGTSATYTATSDTTYSGIRIVIYSGTTCNNLIFKPMLNEGSTALPYEPYYNYELCKIGTYQDRIFETSGKNLFDSLIELGSYDNSTGLPANNGSAIRTKTPIEVTPNTTYTLSNNLGYHPFVYEYGESDNFIQYTRYDVTTATFTTSATTKYIRVRTNATNVENKTSVLFMLNKGSTALPYEPYGSDKWYKKEYIHKENGGNKNWNMNNYDSTYKQFYSTAEYPIGYETQGVNSTKLIMSECFKGAVGNTDGNAVYGGVNTQLIVCIAPLYNGVRFTDTTTFKQFLANNNVHFYIPLATPNDIEITNTTLIEELNELEKMMSYNGQTNISVSGNLPMILDVSALKGESE